MPTYLSQRRRGFSLTEIAIVLGIIGLVISSIWTAYSRIRQQNMISQTITEIMTARNNIRMMYGVNNGGTPGDISTIGQLVFPEYATGIWNGGTIWGKNLWGDGWRIGVGLGNDLGGAASGDTTHFYLYSGAIPANICSQVVMQLLGTDATHLLVNYGNGWGGWQVPSAIAPLNTPCWPFGTGMAIGVEFSFH